MYLSNRTSVSPLRRTIRPLSQEEVNNFCLRNIAGRKLIRFLKRSLKWSSCDCKISGRAKEYRLLVCRRAFKYRNNKRTFKNVRTVYDRRCLIGLSHIIILISSVSLQENLPFPQVSHRASVSLVLFLVKHWSPSFPARRSVPTLLKASQGLIFSPSPSLTFRFRWCVKIPVRFHCLQFTWHVQRNCYTPAFLKGFDPELLIALIICVAPPLPRPFEDALQMKIIFSTLYIYIIKYFILI